MTSENFTVTVTDGSSLTDSKTLTINLTGANDTPVATNDVIYVSDNTNVIIPVSALLANDSDRDGLSLSMTGLGSATGISSLAFVAGSNNALISFTTAAFTGGTTTGTGSFTYTLSDGLGGTTTGTVTVNIVDTGSTGDTVNLSTFSYQASYISGDNGADSVTGSGAVDIFVGGRGDDTLIGSGGNDILRPGANAGGGAQNDSVDGGAGTDLIDFSDMTAGFTFTLGAGGNGGPTTVGGSTVTYTSIEGVIGGSGNDTLTGNAGDNIIRGGAGNDTINGAGGIDLLDLSDGTAGINFTLSQGVGVNVNLSSIGLSTATGDTYSNMEGVIGTNFNDTLTGSNQADRSDGGGGNDLIRGGAGNDTLTGGLGADTFEWKLGDQGSGAPAAIDRITDFGVGGTDKIDLRDLLQLESHTGTDVGNLADYLHFSVSGGNTTIDVKHTGALGSVTQQIILDGVDLTGGSTLTDSQIIQSLFTQGKLVTD